MTGEAGGLFVLGLIYGMTLCSLSCLPYLAPYIAGTGTGFKDGVKSSFVFLCGKVLVYTAFGGLAAYIGSKIVISDYRLAANTIGISLILIGISLPFFTKKKGCSGRHRTFGKRASLFMLGISTSLIPCPTLGAMTLLAANNGEILLGLLYGLTFGLGIMVSPLLLAGGGIAMISDSVKAEVKGFSPYINALSVLIIVMMGINIIRLDI